MNLRLGGYLTGVVRSRRNGFVVILTVLALGLVSAVATGASWDTIGKESARGDFATAVAGGDVNKPRALRVIVQARPNQKAAGSYSVTCSRGGGAGSESGNLSGNAPFKDKMKMPYSNPDYCSAAASVQLDDGGHLKIKLQAKR